MNRSRHSDDGDPLPLDRILSWGAVDAYDEDEPEVVPASRRCDGCGEPAGEHPPAGDGEDDGLRELCDGTTVRMRGSGEWED